MDEDERQRKLEAGRAKKPSAMPRSQPLASFRERRAKGDSEGAQKKTAKRKGQNDPKIDRPAQERPLEPAPAPASGAKEKCKINHEVPQKPKTFTVQIHGQKIPSQHPSQGPITSPVEEMEDELIALTGKEQLKQLQQAVEKRNEIIAKLSFNLQEAQASRDQVQLEAQSLAGQIQALQKQLQQTSVEFLRIKCQTGVPESPHFQQRHGSKDSVPSCVELPLGELKESLNTNSKANGDTETDALLLRLGAELEEERSNSRRICEELAKEKDHCQNMLSLLEEENREIKKVMKQREAQTELQLRDLQEQISQAQSQSFEIQRYKEEKELLNTQLQETSRMLVREQENAERLKEEVASSALRLCTLEEERERREEETRRLEEEHREELDRIRQLLEEGEKEIDRLEKEDSGIKASKNRQNQERVSFGQDEDEEGGPGQEALSEDGLARSVCTDILMERYLSTAKSNSCQANQSFEEHILEENSANYSFELNSEILGDPSHLFSISNPLRENYDNLLNFSDAQCSAASDLVLDCYPRGVSPGWPITSPCSGDAEFGEASRQPAEEPADLAKALLGQQCEELRDELDLKERELDILREEVSKSAEELEEARSRWAQVTEELKEALWELEEEREKQRSQEQELEEENLYTSEQDHFENKDSPFLEEKEDGSSMLFFTTTPPSALLADKLPGDLTEVIEEKAHLDLQAKDQIVSELVDTKARHETTAALLVQKTLELDSALKDLNTTRLQVEAAKEELEKMEGELEESRRNLGSTEEQRSRLEDELVSLKHTLVPLEEAQVQAGEAHRLKEEEMDRQLRKMEQILEEELEQFETLIQAKEEELAEVREKWEDEQQEKEEELRGARRLLEEQRGQQESEVKTLMEKQAMALEETTKRLRQSHHEEVEELSQKHQAEMSELNRRLERELSAQKAALGEEHKKQISLIKQVTEREHQRMLSELSAGHGEEMSQLRLELTSRLTDCMETAHHAEIQQAQTKQSVDMEALRLSLADLHTSRLELSQANLQREREAALSQVQAELRDKWTGENAMLQAKQQFELERLRQQNQQDLDELRQQYESRLLEEKSLTEMNRANEIQVMKSQWEEETEKSMADLRTVLSETQKSLDDTVAELAVTRTSLEELRASSVADVHRLEEELNLAWADRDAAASSLEELVSSKQTLLKEKELQSRHLEEKERLLQQEVSHLQEELTTLKKTSEQETGHLWSQLDSMRTSRQELGELREQLLARSSRVDDLERLKADFNDQRREIKQHNEAELEGLRRYFEQRLRTTEESYREEIALLQLRLVESALEESLLKTGDASFTTEGDAAEERNNLLAEFTLKLEKHKEDLDSLRLQLEEKHEVELSNLRGSLSLSYKEELLQARSDLTERYYEDLETMKTRHALDLEQLRARLSEKYVKELTKVRFEAARQVEVEVEQRMWCHSEELRSRMTIIHTLEGSLSALGTQHATELQRNTQLLKKDFANDLLRHLEEARQLEKQRVVEELSSGNQEEVQRLRAELQKEHQARISSQEEQRTHLEEELEKSRAMVASLESDQSHHDGEMREAKSSMSAEVKELAALLQKQGEERLQQADLRFQEEKGQLEQRLAHKESVSLGEWNNKHQAALEQQRTALLTKHAQELHGVTTGHKEQLDALSARHRDQLAAMATELDTKHTAVLVAMEASLDSKWKAELEHLAAVFQETNQAQLEALESELSVGHKNERDELERRMLSNMDTLEATYLKEVQALRDDMEYQEESHTQDVERLKAAHAQELERLQTELVSGREGLRMELAQMHMGKFSAMATELSNAHKVDLSAQKEALDAEHCKALETLKMQVLELEEQHGNALQELSHSYKTEKQQLCDQHQLQLQELRQVSAQELEVCRRELKEDSSRQHVQFKEQMQLFKVQSEERLQDGLGKLKAELEQCKEAQLEEQRRGFSTEHEQKERGYTEKMSQLTAQLQQLDDVVAQLRAEVDGLQGELEGKRAEMETLDTLLQRREREGQEGGNLLNMLGQDLQTAKEDRLKLHQANEKLRKVLLDVIRSTVATEEMIGQKITVGPRWSQQPANHRSSTGNSEAQESGVSLGEDSELTQLLCESLLVSETQLHPAGEEAALGACGRLRLAVDTLLELLNQANAQLEQAHSLHLSLEQRCSKGREDSGHILKQHTVLLEQLNQEAGLKSHLHLELHKAEGLLDGYVSEKVLLEEALQQKESREERLAEELEGLRVQLHQTESLSAELEGLRVQLRQMEGLTTELNHLRAQHQDLNEEHAVLLRQREHLSAGLGEREKALLAETECLVRERLDLQRQAEKDRNTLSLRLRTLETELEERETKGLETELHHKAHSEDLNMRVQALEKQIKHNRQFIDEQAVEREHERDEFQQEIHRLEDQLRQTSRGQAGGESRGQRIEDLVQQVESLQALVKDKTEDYDSLIAANQQAQNDLMERNDEIDKLAGRIRELEQALLSSADSNRAASQLEQEVQRTKLRERELLQDKQGLEQQQLANKLQIAALQSKLDESRRYHDDAPDPTQPLRDALDTAQLSLQSREQEVELLMSQLEQVQANFSIKEVELKHLALQLELMTNQNEAHVQQLQDKIVTLEENVSALTIQLEEREELREEEESLPSALLQEKNLEIDQLNQEIQRLEVEMEGSERDVALGAELEELRSRVEHLGSDISRLRQDKQDEEERLHEVISTLQAELATLGPALHEVSDSQDGDSVNPSSSPSPELRNYPLPGGAGRRGAPGSLRQELRLTRSSPSFSSSSKSLRARLDVLQTQLETAAAEKESLQRLLLTQEEEYRGYGEELGRRLAEGRERAEELGELLAQKEAQLEEANARIAQRPEKETQEEEERWRAQALEINALRGERDQLSSAVVELRQSEVERVETQKKKEKELADRVESLREANVALQTQIQHTSARVEAMERLVADGKGQVLTLELVKAELFAEREALRRREGRLQEEIECLRQEVVAQRAVIKQLQLRDKEEVPERDQKKVLTHAELTLAKADLALREKEAAIASLSAEQQALRAELAAVKEGLCSSTERAEKLQEEGQTKDRALADLETYNHRLKAELRGLQEDLAVQEEELAYQQRELHHLRQRCEQQEDHTQGSAQKALSHGGFEDHLGGSRDEASLSSPEVLRRLECSEDRTRDPFHASVLQASRLSLNSTTGLDLPQGKPSTKARMMEQPRSRTITPESVSRSTRSPGSTTASDNFSMACSLDVDKMDTLDLTAPPSPVGSLSSLSAPEWASDGYGSNVSSELGVRLRAELEHTERLDAQFVEYLRCRGMNPAANTDSAAGSWSFSDELLSPELQEILKRVHQESCRILTLSQRRATTSSQHQGPVSTVLSLDQTLVQSHDQASPLDRPDGFPSAPPMGWQQEKRALQETVVALRELLCRMAQRDTQGAPGGDDKRQQMATAGSDGRVEEQLRAELQETQKQLREELEETRKQLRVELGETQSQLSASQVTQQEHRNAVQSLRLALQAGEESLQEEQSHVEELQALLEQERALTLRREREEEERREVMQGSLEQKGSEVVALSGQLEQETVACSNLRRELQIEQSRSGLLEKRLGDAHGDLQEECKRSAQQHDLHLQERSRLERLLAEAEARLDAAHGTLEEEKERCASTLDGFGRRQEANAARDRKLVTDMQAQLEQERRQGEELAAVTDRLRAELLQVKRRGEEEEEQRRRDEARREKEAAARLRHASESLKEQKRAAGCALAAERERGTRQGAELAELKERLQAATDEEREREKQRERERRKDGQKQMERERRQERTNNKLCELELLREQDQQRMKELQQTLSELEREGREMAAQRLSGSAHQTRTGPTANRSAQTDDTVPRDQAKSSPELVQRLLGENSELTERVAFLSQERVALKHTLAGLERQRRRAENDLAKAAMETENRPIIGDAVGNGKVQRLYERYLRAESFRKSLVYQKRYLVLLLGGFQECEQATLCLIASMGARPSSTVQSKRRPLGRFRAAVCAVIAVSRMKFLTKKWNRAIRRMSISGGVNGHSSGYRPEVLRLQQRSNSEASPPTRDGNLLYRDSASTLVPPVKSPFRLHNRAHSGSTVISVPAGTSQDPERTLTEYIHHLEKVQRRLVGSKPGSSALHIQTNKSEH
ncbi:pericentrin-like [Gadus chalcogrammus]|uniref:pericentrin-like n=1 Tax=Gadus chalcogrammus TaxID=1042646 RepID=UPI0024C24965|nr:pericentrin-like [Gadus chalcogrammus]